jgi:hypothetical protein
MKAGWMSAAVAAGALVLGGSAWAEAPKGDYSGEQGFMNKVSLAAGLGVDGFTGSLGDHTNPGIDWNVRGTYDASKNIGLEVGYLGAANQIDDTRLPFGRNITTTSLGGDLKLSAPIGVGNVTIKPYLFGGIGGAYYGVSGGSSLYASDSDLQFPVGLGGDAFLTNNLSVGARLGWFINVANRIGDQAGGSQMDFTADVGVHY